MGKALYLPFESVVLSKSFVMEGHYLNFTVKSTDPLHAGYIERKLLFMYFYFKESRENIFLWRGVVLDLSTFLLCTV